MGLPRHLPDGGRASGRGPFGEKAFRGALVGCGVLLAAGLITVLSGEGARSVGASLLVLGALGLTTGGAGLLAERLLGRRPPPAREVTRANGHRPKARDRP